MTSKVKPGNTVGGNSTSLQAVLENQKAIVKVEGTIAVLEQAINTQESVIAEATATVKVPESLVQKREDLLAEISVGNAASDELTKLDAEIDRQNEIHGETSAKAEQVITPARQTVAGLRRKLGQAEAELKALTEERGSLRQALYRDEAEKAGADYVRVANELHALLMRLIGFNELIEGRNVLGISTERYAIPTMRLKAFEDEQKCGPFKECMFHGDLFGYASSENSLWPATLGAVEIDRLRAMGME
jgi:uncharacterized coiled-coil protein SlyX